MTQTMPIIEARNKLTTLPEEFQKDPQIGAVEVTRRGKPVLAILPWELYESLLETMEIMSDEKLMNSLRKSIQQAKSSELIPWEKVKEDLNL
ncbi:MAG: type II toxin-antitoxin system prevent-host-death family antitoxin [Blastocatellia bacterium]